MLSHENAITQKLLEVEPDWIHGFVRLRVLVELVLQDVADDLCIVRNQHVHPRVPAETQALGDCLPTSNFESPIVDTMDIRYQVFQPANRLIVPGPVRRRHVFQKASYERMSSIQISGGKEPGQHRRYHNPGES